MEGGLIDGCFSTNEVESIFAYLQSKYPKHIRKERIGETFEGRELLTYVISTGFENSENKSKILFTGAHHAREVLNS